ncbi:GNAT family N-acetyltransferase [Achromobacter aegrifaciens]
MNKQHMALSLHRFCDVPVEDWLELLNNPAVIRHMPLTHGNWTARAASDWVKGKDRQWLDHGYGPWSIRIGGQFAGWGGFQREGEEADLALVLLPAYWGQGARIFRHLMSLRAELGIGPVSILLPPSRSRFKGLARLGFVFAGELTYEGQRFLKFRTCG